MHLPMAFDDFAKQMTGPAVCATEGCTRPARWVLEIKTWARGHPKSSHDPVRSILSWRVCDDHRHPVVASEFWVDDTKKMITKVLAAYGKSEPDFDTAEFTWVLAATSMGPENTRN